MLYGEVIADCTHVQAIRRSQSRVAQGASSQSGNRSTVFSRQSSRAYLGSFCVTGANGNNGVLEPHGADLTPVVLLGYPQGMHTDTSIDNPCHLPGV